MSNIFRLKRGTGVPLASDLVTGEIAINTTDGTAYTKKDDGSVVQIGGTGGGGTAIAIPQYDNFVTYTTGSQVVFSNRLFYMSTTVGAAGYDPISYPSYWTEISTDTVGISDAPSDNNMYARMNGGWYVISGGGGGGGTWGSITGTISNQTDLQSALDAKAPLDSPALTGIPTAPTASYPDSSTQIATTAFVQDALNNGTASASKSLHATVRNETAETLTKGTAVYISGAASNKPLVSKAIATGDPTSAGTYGLLKDDISSNQNGIAVIAGLIEGIDTSAYSDGDKLYLSPTVAGGWTTTKPSAPDHIVFIGVVSRSHQTQGAIELRIQNGFEIEELHNVAIASPANNDLLAYDFATELWKNKTAADIGLLDSATASSTYQTQSGMSSYLTTSNASLTYQPLSAMNSYLTIVDANSTYLKQSSNLGDLGNKPLARTNLGLGTAAVEPATKLVPTGGTTGQVLTKTSNTNWDLSWTTVSGGGGGGGIDIQTFGSSTTSGTFTWTKPANAKLVEVILWSGGSGGGAGGRYATTSGRSGGGGGAGGTLFWGRINANFLNSTQSVVVGAGGIGGSSALADSSAGGNGVAGGNTTFSIFQSGTPNAGSGGLSSAGTAASSRSSMYNYIVYSAGQGGAGNTNTGGVAVSQGSGGNITSTGGGGGGGMVANTTLSVGGGAGGNINANIAGIINAIAGGSAGTVAGVSPTAGTSATTQYFQSGTGGGGGAYRSGVAGMAGAAGGWPSGGGGGGSASDNGFPSGAGGAGANGYAIIITYT